MKQSSSRRGALNYEDVVAEQIYPRKPRETYPRLGANNPYQEGAHRFVRTLYVLTNRSCFNATERGIDAAAIDIPRCCHEDVRQRPSDCFNMFNTYDLCCGKEKLWDRLFGPQGDEEQLNATLDLYGTLSPTRVRRARVCSQLEAVDDETLPAYTRALLALPFGQQAACIAGTLAHKYARASMAHAVESLTMIRLFLKTSCPGRRVEAALRRNLMLWRYVVKGGLPTDVQEVHLKTMLLLERCRKRHRKAPVYHLHVPKTAGGALCTWANSTGFGGRRLPKARCQFRGDGAFWLADPGVFDPDGSVARNALCTGVFWRRRDCAPRRGLSL
eukprot:TRINITY_DN28452_c0_g1_i3.p1 TRINITY_DN28452_c0_g1~~TRINITY_DN28452_c0_g1_i3.p1  ORF type:complete len:330 (-),score=40.98 TRINITY_DN28452_c0_g1_i3:190-1179(-)